MTPDSASERPSERPFDLAAILSITHSLPIMAAPHVELLEWITGHSMPGPLAALPYLGLCADWLTETHPRLGEVAKRDFDESDYAAQDAWVEEVAETLGVRVLPVAPMPADRVCPDSVYDVLGDAGVLNKTYVIDPNSDEGNDMTTSTTQISTGLATREGTAQDNADAARVHILADGTVGAAVIDGIGHGPHTSATVPLLAQVAARISARRGPLAGLLTAAELIADRGADGEEADAVAVAARIRPGDDITVVNWTGDARAYGWDGITLRLYTDDHTVGQQLRANGVALDIAREHDNWLRTSLARATVGTVYTAGIRDQVVILTSDGVHDQVDPHVMTALVREHANDPQKLADELVDAAQPDDDGYRDDASAVVLRRAD